MIANPNDRRFNQTGSFDYGSHFWFKIEANLDGVDYRGILACLDGYMNIALEQTEEYVNGQVISKEQKDLERVILGESHLAIGESTVSSTRR